MASSKYKPARSSQTEKICLWTKFQPHAWLLALSGPVFLFEPKNKLPRLMAPSKNKPARSSRTEKICLWTKFQPPTWLLALSRPVFLFRPLNKLTHRQRYQKINNATLCALKKSTFCQSFILLLQKFKQL